MTTQNQLSHRVSRWFLKTVIACCFAAAITVLYLLIQKKWGGAVQLLCGIYTVATGLFFLAQLVGFVMAQTRYSDEIEAPKFKMLENEEAQWVS